MISNKEIIIRKVKIYDIEKLKLFFIKAYGKQTIFQNEKFLLYFFSDGSKESIPLSSNIIALNQFGEIVSHYGGLRYNIAVNDKIMPIIWGVNAYTLPEWRAKGINSKIVDFIIKNNEINAVIGMPNNAPYFYKKRGYNIFNKSTLNRFVFVIDDRTFDIVNIIGQNSKKARKLLPIKSVNKEELLSENIIKLTNRNINIYELKLKDPSVLTTYRDINFIKWRLIANPYIDYKVYGYLEGNKIISYIAIREETISLNNSKVIRIIDLFGNNCGVSILLKFITSKLFIHNHIYIDFSSFGKMYQEELISAGFSKLENEDICLLPQVTSPISDRPNNEFIVIQSKVYDELIQTLSKENVYFTRIDGDRDRIANIFQIRNNL